jgi:hypothetical protein
MRAGAAEVGEDGVVGAACFLQGVGEDGEAGGIEMAGRQISLFVGGLGQAGHVKGEQNRGKSDRA